ncbi:hypothetical protein [Dyadobacter luticola]|uniref:Uncharacterized protein n=1 Tax=Dyadobacter luticola TaxID=1979387 RepID=A0A5R9L2C1_9BACT|nr:hypothetical protein [Dyadobacter luticola]TLV02489.1 hypothetical protein FEN17_02355 [Dyadobacter luticola]
MKTDSIKPGRNAMRKPKGWSYDDGGAQWRTIDFDTVNPPAHLPNFMEYVGFPYKELKVEGWNPVMWRNYYPNNSNGAVGIASLLIVVQDLKAARDEFRKIGFKELEDSDTLARFKVADGQELHLKAPNLPGDAFSKFLKKRGQGVYAVRFDVKNSQHATVRKERE